MTNINIFIIAFLIIITATIFWLWMISDCIHKKFKHRKSMLEWFFILIFTYIIGALIYYFIVKKRKKKSLNIK